MKGYWFNKKNSINSGQLQAYSQSKSKSKISLKNNQDQGMKNVSSTKNTKDKQRSTRSMSNIKTDQKIKKQPSSNNNQNNNSIKLSFSDNDLILREFFTFHDSVKQVSNKVIKMDEYYTLLINAEKFGHTVSRCYRHNSQIILYCVRDRSCLCAQCMYGANAQKITKNVQKLIKSKEKFNTNSKNHTQHQVLQIHTCIQKIQDDLRINLSTFKAKQNQFTALNRQWKKFQNTFKQTKIQYLNKLQKQYDLQLQELSRKYLKTKNQIQQITSKVQSKLQEISKGLNSIKKLGEPTRFILPVVRHVWFQQIFILLNMGKDSNTNSGLGKYINGTEAQNNVMYGVKKYIKGKLQVILSAM